MKPLDIQHVGNELAIKWDDGAETYIPLSDLRLGCPCAGCKGEVDVLGHLHRAPAQPLASKAFELMKVVQVGGYAIQPIWADGHSTGLFSFESLRTMAKMPEG